MIKPKILFMDLETTPNMMATWGLWDQHLNYKQIIKERSIICGAWKWAGDPKVEAVSIKDCTYRYKRDVYDDLHVVKKLRRVFEKADIIVGHNGDKYDIRFLNGRMLVHGVSPLPPTPTVDTLKIMRQKFRLNCNRLDYAGQLLGIGGKFKTEMEMWTDIIDPAVSYARKDEQIDRMVDYNKQDVLLLEKLYTKLAGWSKTHPSLGLISGKEDDCPHCGSEELTTCKIPYRTKTRAYEMYACGDCGGFSVGGRVVGKGVLKCV